MSVLEWAIAERGLHGESGDRAVVAVYEGGALVAVIDGLGHGSEAAKAASVAATLLEANASCDVIELLERCHEKLRSTRGAVISLARFDARHNTMTWIGVGNVEGVVSRSEGDQALVTRGGTVGFTLPALQARTLALRPGDTLVLATDGVRTGFRGTIVAAKSPEDIANEILAQYAKGTDDVCIVVARYIGHAEAARAEVLR